ncbi:MAG: polysaccharide deacetylase family protein [Gammaproteobacteria bacterium]|nr:polysaccharide deacetylase family protein [Gammaproteobacteria bacterium]
MMNIRPVTGIRARLRKGGMPSLAGVLLSLFVLLAADAAGAGPSNAVVFMYHRFGEPEHPSTSVRLEQFDDHLDHLAAAGYQVWPLQRIVDRLRDGGEIPDRTVAITIDDAYLSVYTGAWPRLKRRGWPFTVFVATGAVDDRLPDFMSWAQMREMQAGGAVFSNHSASHDYLIRRAPGESPSAWNARVTADIGRAQRRLEEELGAAPMLFAYPYGEYDRPLAELVEGLGYTAFGQHSGALGPWSDLRALPRFPMAEAYAGRAEFEAKAAAFALPVRAVEPWDPVVTGTKAPLMRATLATGAGAGDARLDALRCFDQGGVRIGINWIERKGDSAVFSARAAGGLPAGRSRYNCTAPSASRPDRYYWFSHLWIRP